MTRLVIADDFESFRGQARALVAAGVPPEALLDGTMPRAAT